MKLKCLSLVVTILVSVNIQTFAQSPVLTEKEIIAELERRGLDRELVEEELIARGIDITSLEDVTPEEIQIIREVILDAEQNLNNPKKDISEDEDEIDETIEKDTIELNLDKEREEDQVQVEKLPEAEIYGQELFRKDLIRTYTDGSDLDASENYILGSGDIISISIWGRSQLDKQYPINEKGYVVLLSGSRRVFLQGLTLAQAREKLTSVLSQSYKFTDGEMDLSLIQSRTVTVNIRGEVYRPGTITIPAINDAFNALAESQGPTNIGSVRNIELKKRNGKNIQMDVYKYMSDANYSTQFSIDDNDVILIPIAENVVEIHGAIKRPMKYELLKDEGIIELIKYAGGVNANALLKTVRIQRYENDQRIVTDLDLRQLTNSNSNFRLRNGDFITIDTIVTIANNYVEVQGEVNNPGQFERSPNMQVFDVLKLAGLKDVSRTDIAFIKRKNDDSSFEFEEINIDDILTDPSSPSNLRLRNEDIITIWGKDRFTDEGVIQIDGAIRFPDEFPYDVSKRVKLREAVILAGGLRRDASNFGTIFRKDPLNPKVIEYLTVTDLNDVIENPLSEENIELNPFDSIFIYSDNTFLEESFVSIYGAVNNPGNFQYGKNMNIEDLIVLAGGFKISAATNNVEVSRVIIKDNEPTNVVIAKLELDRNSYKPIGANQNYTLAPFDKVAVRYVPEFELQESIILKGEVKSPGAYAIVGENETISSIIKRAGGLTKEAFPEGASLQRVEDDYGAIVVKLNDIFENPNSKFDFIVRGGDTITIPKRRQFVTIAGATNVWEVLSSESINQGNEIHVPYHEGKNALFYINHYAGGFNESANKKSLVVRHPNGEVKKLQGFGLFNKYPDVKEGSVISVSFKTTEQSDKESNEKVNWTQILGDSVGQAMSILTLLLLIQNFD